MFQVAGGVRDNPLVAVADRDAIAGLLSWFSEHLKTPERFNRTRSKGYQRRRPRGIAWFRDSAVEHLARMHQLKTLLEANGCVVSVLTSARIGYVVYEDEHQVIAEPFADTRTG